MNITLLSVREGGSRRSALAAATTGYLSRCGREMSATWTTLRAKDEIWRLRQKPASYLILLDSRGAQKSSEEFAAQLGGLRDGGKREILIAIGPADGWTADDRKTSDALLSLGKMTLPHELAALVAAEQIYRATTILAGHPYHCGH